MIKVSMTSTMMVAMSAMVFKSWLSFKVKMVVLIAMEVMFLITILSHLTAKPVMSSSSVALLLTIFMVLDSTMGMSIMVNSSRSSYPFMSTFKSI